MRIVAAAALLLLFAGFVPARAEHGAAQELLKRIERYAGLTAGDRSGPDVIVPPDNLDPKMALTPPDPHGTMRVFKPKEDARP